MASTEPPKPVKHKTCVLRVSIHCEGCKRKVNKILQSIPGVHDVEIERQLHRVVVTGDVSPENLVRKLVKSGKHAALWPENPPQNHNHKTEKLTGNEVKEIKSPETKPEAPAVESAVSGEEIKPPEVKTEVPPVDPSKSSDPVVQSGEAPAGNARRKKVVEDFGGKADAEVKNEEKKPETGPATASDSASPPEVEKKKELAGNDGGVVAGAGEGKKKKKKKKKEGQNSNLTASAGETSSPIPPQQNVTRSINQSPPRQQGNKYLGPNYHVPVYTVSYNTAHPPVNSYTASYYAAAPPHQSYAYSHYHGSPPSPPPLNVPSDYYESYTQQPVDSFEMFSDENPNGCLIM